MAIPVTSEDAECSSIIGFDLSERVTIFSGMNFIVFTAVHLVTTTLSHLVYFTSPYASNLCTILCCTGVKLLLPVDIVLADKFSPDAEVKISPIDSIPDEWMGLDIGPQAISAYKEALSSCKTIVWNGPLGVFEFDKFAEGTFAIARALADLTNSGATTIIGGGDSVAAVEKAGLSDKMR